MDFDDARLHEADQSCDIVNREHRLFVTGIDTVDPLVQPLPRMAAVPEGQRSRLNGRRPEALEDRRRKQSVAGPTAVFDLADEARLDPTDAFLGAGGERFCE